MLPLPLTNTAAKKPEAVVLRPWYEHPTDLRCLCGQNTMRKYIDDKYMHVTRFECPDDKCGRLVVFVHLFDIDSVTRDMIYSQLGLPVGR